ncbi:hypothetical protein ABZP36_014590 [Zizania latifolia]
MSNKRQGPPKHQNRFAWKPNLGQKINETVSPRPASCSFSVLLLAESHRRNPRRAGAWRQVPAFVGYHRRLPVLQGPNRLEAQVEKSPFPAVDRSVGNGTSDRRDTTSARVNFSCSIMSTCYDGVDVLDLLLNPLLPMLNAACSKDLGICAKCCTRVKALVGRDASEEESERKALEEAIRGARERERRTLLRLMNKSNGGESGPSDPKIADRSREGDIFHAASLDEYAEQARQQDGSDEEEAGDFVED